MAENGKVLPIDITSELRHSFIDYAMSVIVSRAIPDVRDGLKPVHRRIIYAMLELGMTPDKPYKKSARIVGDVLAKYHPHGDTAVYDALVRLAQDFSTRYLLVDGHGNFGSVDGDAAAAMRYTESRMTSLALEMVRDINKETVDFQPNYDGSEKEPTVLPSRFPNLLVNGSSGIAVGMATNMPPHNLTEIIDGVVMLIDRPDATIDDLMTVIKGPDFPTYGVILGRDGIRKAYHTGHGSLTIRAVHMIEEASNGKVRIVITELPYQVNKARLIEKIAELAREKKIDGITDLRDESDRKGMRIVIELRRDVRPQVILNNLYKHTPLQTTFGVNALALVNGQPRVLSLRELLFYYLEHQKEVIVRRTRYDLRKAEARAHILEGLRIALDHLDEVIQLIRSSATVDLARTGLITTFSLSEEQAQAILDMRLQRLTGLEREKIENEYRELQRLIAEYRAILADEAKVLAVVRKEILDLRNKFGDARRTRIVAAEGEEFDEGDLIQEQDVVITITHAGYIKRAPSSTYRSQRRGGRGVTAMGTKDEDFVEHMFITSSHNNLLIFTNRAKVYRLMAYEVPELGRTAKGVPIINLLNIEQGEKISAVIPVSKEDLLSDDFYLFTATRDGIIKKTSLSAFSNIRKVGLIALSIREDDELIGVRLTDGKREIIMGTKYGMSIRFPESDVRPMGRTAAGVKGITLEKDDEIVGMDVVQPNTTVLVVSTKGYGKRTSIDDYRTQTRGGKGIKTLNVTEKNGNIVALKVVHAHEDLMIITNTGVAIRLPIDEISVRSRNTQGIRLINLSDDSEVSSVARVASSVADGTDDSEETKE
ncbi:DNA gyrase subunit A [Sulfoacidibacillus thermotolerans]|uniref:DNA gyrase subunit A n=2 Tax=Alicyclobacillaceae TaxID=186823 RepID=A0A2U3D6A8_SULT2|nr:DNA gyrase subunit A [Sulfoacidibacillus thermotolerans]PWI56803.1 DNA gyrase subunit A [Sulfoacidibacillus thermotolerans]